MLPRYLFLLRIVQFLLLSEHFVLIQNPLNTRLLVNSVDISLDSIVAEATI